jgi:hypothetical protein
LQRIHTQKGAHFQSDYFRVGLARFLVKLWFFEILPFLSPVNFKDGELQRSPESSRQPQIKGRPKRPTVAVHIGKLLCDLLCFVFGELLKSMNILQ